MKKIIFTLGLLLLFTATMYAQSGILGTQRSYLERAKLEKTYTNFTATSDDTSGWFTASEPAFTADYCYFPVVYLIGVSTDSVNSDVYVIGRNSFLTTVTTTYADSFNTTSNTGTFKVIPIRSSEYDNLPGCTQFKVGTVFRATLNGTTSGRYLKWYLSYYKP